MTRNVEYYSIGHFSKFIRYGAYRVSSSISTPVAGLDHVSFINTDGKKVTVVTNSDTTAKSFTIKGGERQFNYSLAGKAVVTLVWE